MKTKLTEWQEAWLKATCVTQCSPTERIRAMQYLHDTGIGYNLPGGVRQTLKQMVEAGEIKTGNEEVSDGPH